MPRPLAPGVAAGAPPRPLIRCALVALPAVVVGLAGLSHPTFLTPQTAARWQAAHLVLVPLFPLVGAALWVVLRGDRSPLAQAARALAFVYAVLYLSLDAIAGIGAPHQVLGTVRRSQPFPPINDLYEIGDRLGHAGVVCLGVAAVFAGAVLFRRTRRPVALVGAALVAGACYPFLRFHVFPPYGVTALVVLGIGQGLMEASRDR